MNWSNATGSAILLLLLACPPTLKAQQTSNDGDTSASVNEDFRQLVIDEIVKRRGLSADDVTNADSLIKSAEDIREFIQVSCELAGACSDDGNGRITSGEILETFPEYDEQEGARNAQLLFSNSQDGQ